MTENLQHHPANRNFAGEAPLADLLPHVFSLDGLRDRKGRRRINLVQDERLRERLCEHWKQQKEMPFGGLLEMARTPFWAWRPAMPGIRGTKRPFTLAHCVALDLPLELIQSLLKRAVQVGQILEERKACWDHTGQLLLLHLSNLREYNVNQRKLFNDHGQIQASLFYTKCEAVHELMLRDFSFLESLVLYGNLLEDLCHRVSLHFAGLSSEPGETNVDQVEQFIDVRQVEYLSLCDRVLLQPEHTILRQFLRKHFAGYLFQQFALVKLRKDLLHFVEIQPLDLANPLEGSLTLS
ncbi:MAG: hypothetical protein VXW13_00090 [SAR324 cluster bacterium]|nr:hypothetical protein [SAR324 cluster bacterium]